MLQEHENCFAEWTKDMFLLQDYWCLHRSRQERVQNLRVKWQRVC